MHLDLGFRAFDPHELLPHAIATSRGLYDDAGITVGLVDLTFAPDLEVQVSCGSAMLGRLAGADLRIALVASRHPLFWIYTRRPQESTEPLRIAGYPDGSPPAVFTRMLLPNADVIPARDTDTRLGLLLTGDTDAAIISTATPLNDLDVLGLHRLLAFPDHLTLPTTGLAAPIQLLDSPEITATTTALRAALRIIEEDVETVARTLTDVFRYDPTSAEHAAPNYAPWFTTDGRIPADEAAAALTTLAQATDAETIQAEHVFAATAIRTH